MVTQRAPTLNPAAAGSFAAPVQPAVGLAALFLMSLLSLAACAASSANAVPTGLYRQPATRCTDAAVASSGACGEGTQDCLLLTASADGRWRVEIFSTQTNQHVCVVDASAHLVGNALEVPDPDPDAERGQGLRIVRDGQALVLQQIKPGRAGYQPFCGARASLDGLRFDLVSRVAADGACVPAGVK